MQTAKKKPAMFAHLSQELATKKLTDGVNVV
jgi:hypothetical protein